MRRDITLRMVVEEGQDVLEEVWLERFDSRGERVECLSLVRCFADAEWAGWQATASAVIARGQQALF